LAFPDHDGVILKYLALIVLAFVVWRVWRSLGRAAKRREAAASGTLVACAHCGVFIPLNDTVQDAAGHRYCSAAHRTLGKPSA
jgi:uncharacterized protein